MFLSSLVKLSYTITHDGLTKQNFVQLQFQLELPPLDHTQPTPAADSAQVDKSCWRV